MDRAERQRLDIESRSHGLEVRKHDESLELRKQELELRRLELQNQKKLRYTNLTVAIIAASAAIGGTIAGALVQGNKNSEIETQRSDRTYELEKYKANETIKLEKRKLEAALIAKTGESGDVLQVVKRLKFWIQLNLVSKELLPELELALNQDPTLLISHSPRTSTVDSKPTVSAPPPNIETDAIQRYRQRIAGNPRDTDALIFLGYALLKQGRTSEAIENLQKSIVVNPKSEWGLYNLALAYFSGSRVPEAENTINSLLTLNPSFRSIIRKHRQFDEFSGSSNSLREILK